MFLKRSQFLQIDNKKSWKYSQKSGQFGWILHLVNIYFFNSDEKNLLIKHIWKHKSKRPIYLWPVFQSVDRLDCSKKFAHQNHPAWAQTHDTNFRTFSNDYRNWPYRIIQAYSVVSDDYNHLVFSTRVKIFGMNFFPI